MVDKLAQPVRLAPLTKFPLVRDLVVDRNVMFNNLKKVKAWIEIDGTYDMGPGPRISPQVQEQSYLLSKCMTCGCCMEACPNFNQKSKFIGPAPIAQVDLVNSHPTGAFQKDIRLQALMGEGGIAECGNAGMRRTAPKLVLKKSHGPDRLRDLTGLLPFKGYWDG